MGSKEKLLKDNAIMWKSSNIDGVSLYKASFRKFSFNRHTHDDVAIGVIENGFQTFYHKGRKYVASPGSIISVNPCEVHDGSPAEEKGYSYRMSYFSSDTVKEIFKDSVFSGDVPFAFSSPTTEDRELSAMILRGMHLLEKGEDLESQSLFIGAVTELFRRYASPVPERSKVYKDKTIIKRAIEFICSRLDENITLKDISDYIGMSQYHFIRTFKETTGLPPHSYIIQRRVINAKKEMENGHSIVEAAILSGFSDQSHLTRKFKLYYGFTPGEYKRSI